MCMVLLQWTLCFLGSLIPDFLCGHDTILQDSVYMDILYRNFYVFVVCFLSTVFVFTLFPIFLTGSKIVHPHLITVNSKLALPI